MFLSVAKGQEIGYQQEEVTWTWTLVSVKPVYNDYK